MTDARLVLRGLARDDEAAWRLLWAGYLTFYGARLPPAVTEAMWARLLDAAEPLRGIVATLDGRPVGFAHVVLHRSTWNEGPAAYLQDLFVSPSHRALGAGRALIEAARQCAASAGAQRLTWFTREDNRVARSLYDRIGAATEFVRYAAPVSLN